LPEKIAIAEVNNLDQRAFVAKFGALYEHSPWIAERVWHGRPFGSFAQLHGAFVHVVYDAPLDRQIALIRAHPDLAGKAAIAGELTRESAREQVSAGLDRLTPEEYEEFHRLNAAYREKFGFPLIITVRENTKETILAGARARLEHSRSQEIETALGEIDKIARFRLQDLVEQDNREMESTARERKSE
jgi:OHCU decarboxylase